jgi:hypothetical protein
MSKDISIAQQPNYYSQDVLNMALGSFISKQMISILRSSKSISVSQILKLFAILSLDEIRISFMSLIKQLFSIFGNKYLIILQYIDKYILKNIFVRTFRYLINFLLKWGIKPILGIKNDDNNKINIKFTPTIEFMKKFITYIKPENYDILPTHNIKLYSENIITYKQTWINIKIEYLSIKFNILSKLALTFEQKDNNITLLNFNIKNEKFKSNELNHKIEMEICSSKYSHHELYQKFNEFIFFITNYTL